MDTKRAHENNKPVPSEIASYFGLTVEVVFRMSHYCLIRRCDRECIVETKDLRMKAERRAA